PRRRMARDDRRRHHVRSRRSAGDVGRMRYGARALLPSLSLADLEQMRLILRGGSVVDWFRLHHNAIDDVRAFLALQGGDADDPDDQARLVELRAKAAKYLHDEHGYKIPPELA